MFQFAGFPPPPLWIRGGGAGPSSGGFAHSGTRGSSGVCPYPRTIAACRALLRLPVPRHPPARPGYLLSSNIAIGRPGIPGALHGGAPPRAAHPYQDQFYWYSLFVPRLQIGSNLSSPAPLSRRGRPAPGAMPPGRAYAMRLSRYAGRPRGPDAARAGDAGRVSHPPAGSRNSCEIGFPISLRSLPRKEVIQPHVPVRLPCYDFTPLTPHTFDASPLAVGPAASGAGDSGGVTGGVYKARERIHRGMLIRDY